MNDGKDGENNVNHITTIKSITFPYRISAKGSKDNYSISTSRYRIILTRAACLLHYQTIMDSYRIRVGWCRGRLSTYLGTSQPIIGNTSLFIASRLWARFGKQWSDCLGHHETCYCSNDNDWYKVSLSSE